ncbi:hypothetical protein [Phyllobacterium sp. K27]
MSDTGANKGPATWRIVTAAILDFITAFFVLGYVVATVLGGRTDTGFKLEGLPALVFFVLIVAYFIVFNRYFGGTIWKHILRAQRAERRSFPAGHTDQVWMASSLRAAISRLSSPASRHQES